MGYGMDEEDIGGAFADMDYQIEFDERMEEIRRKRISLMDEKYVIISKGYKSHKLIFLQNRCLSTKRWWSYYLSDTIAFDNLDACIKVKDKLKFGNPKVMLVRRHNRTYVLVDIETGEIIKLNSRNLY